MLLLFACVFTVGAFRGVASARADMGALAEVQAAGATRLPASRAPDSVSQTSTVCQQATASGYGCIEGTVTSASDGTPLSGIEVSFQGFAGVSPDYTVTGSDGTYSLVDYNTGGPYNVDIQFSANGYWVGQCWDDNESCGSPTAVSVTGGQTTSGIDAVMVFGGEITGTVTAASDGSPLSGIYVSAEDSAGHGYQVQTGSDGTYTFFGVHPGSYTVSFGAPSLNYLTQCWNDTDFQCESPTAVSVSAGQTTSGIDAAMVSIVSVTDDSSGVAPGGSLTFTATVTGQSTPYPTGAMGWTVTGPGDTTVPCGSTTGPTNSGVRDSTYTCTIDDVVAGSYTASANYPGDSTYGPASGSDSATIGGQATLTQGPPTSANVAEGAGYSGQLSVTNASGAVSYTETPSAHSSAVVVDSSGAITAAKTLAQGTYTVGGSDSDTAGDIGTWTFTLTVYSCGIVVDSVGQAPPVGTAFNQGDTISTGPGGRLVIQFPDNTELYLGENTRLVCDKFFYDPSDPASDHSVFSILSGVFMYVSGLIGKGHEEEVHGSDTGGGLGIRGSVWVAEMLPRDRVLLHVFQGTGFVWYTGRPTFTFPPGEGVLLDEKTYDFKETLQIPTGALALLPSTLRPSTITALRVKSRAHRGPVLRFRLTEPANLKALVKHGKRTVSVLRRTGKAGANKLTFSKVLPAGRYTVELVAVHDGLTSIKTAPLRIR